jgi:hypothetical protein
MFASPGSETTANALSFAVYLLSRHPEAEAKLTAEIDALGGRHGGSLTWQPSLPSTQPQHTTSSDRMRSLSLLAKLCSFIIQQKHPTSWDSPMVIIRKTSHTCILTALDTLQRVYA